MADELPEISCETCTAACCRAPTFMQLTQEEFDQNSPKMDLVKIRAPSVYSQKVRVGESKAIIFDQPVEPDDPRLTMTLPAGTGLFILNSGCANLTEDHRCSIYEVRPTCCRNFEMGSIACRKTRRKAGLDADRPITDEELAAEAAPDPNTMLVRRYFSETTPESLREAAAAAPAKHQPRPFLLQQVRNSVGRETRWLLELLSECKASDWSKKTRCAGWNVNALTAHIVTCLQTADEVARAVLEARLATWPRDFKGDRFAVMRALTSTADDVCAALDRLPPDALAREVDVDGEGVLEVSHVLEVLIMELGVHGLDLAAALGQERHLQPDAITATANLLAEFLDPAVTPPKDSAYVLRSSAFEVQFGWDGKRWTSDAGPNPCVIEGDPEVVLLFALGRVGFEQSSVETNRPDEARAFKRYLAGP